jgi:hypothetical protein
MNETKTETVMRTPEELAAMYRDRVNNFLTDEAFASYYDMEVLAAKGLLVVAEMFHDQGL